jgi:hypothetical protein
MEQAIWIRPNDQAAGDRDARAQPDNARRQAGSVPEWADAAVNPREAEWLSYLAELYQRRQGSWLALSTRHADLDARLSRVSNRQLAKQAAVVIGAALLMSVLYIQAQDVRGASAMLNVFVVSFLIVMFLTYPFLTESRRERQLRRELQEMAVHLEAESPEWIGALCADPKRREVLRKWPAPDEVTEADVERWPELSRLVTPKKQEMDFQTLYRRYRQTDGWREKADAALAHARFHCQVCTSDDVPLDVYHRTYERIFQERPDDLIVLCESCHRALREGGRLAA